MKENDELLLNFSLSQYPLNKWQGSLRYYAVGGSKVRVLSNIADTKTDLRSPLNVGLFSEIIADADLVKTAILLDLNELERTLSFDKGIMTAAVSFTAQAVAVGIQDELVSDQTKGAKFFISSPIIFSFMNQKNYKYTVTKKGHQVTMRDVPTKKYEFKSKVFKTIAFQIGKSFGSSVDGDVAKINYDASMTLIPKRQMDIWQIFRLSQLIEKLLFLLVGSHCGPMRVDIKGKKKNVDICTIDCSSQFYQGTRVVDGLRRCWTLDRIELDFGEFFDRALANYARIETCLELILEAELEDKIQTKFFKLVRAIENIGRNLFPKGYEEAPEQLKLIEDLVDHDPELKMFFAKRLKPVFGRPNSLGYTIDFIKQIFPIWPVSELNKSEIQRLRNIEAHARAHQFSPHDLQNMQYLSEILDFICRGCLLRFLGMSEKDVCAPIFHHSRFSWFAKDKP